MDLHLNEKKTASFCFYKALMWFVPQNIPIDAFLCFSHLSNHETNMKYYNHEIGKELRHDLLFSSCIGKLMWSQITWTS